MTPNLRCIECRFEGHSALWATKKACPKCGSKSSLIDPDNDLILIAHPTTDLSQGTWIRVGWAELRMLSIWARWWCDQQAHTDPEAFGWMLRAVDAITFNLKKAGGGVPLTIADDLEIIKRANPEAKVVRPDGSEMQMEPGWLNRNIPEEEKS